MPRSRRRSDLRESRRAIERRNPNLKSVRYRISSPKDDKYNCIAFAADVQNKHWWPIRGVPGTVWPDGAPVENTLSAFMQAFETIGYRVCEKHQLESGIEKVAIYVKKDLAGIDRPQHMAWQSPTGRWKSKLGLEEDITHDSLSALEDGQYGRVAVIMKRNRKSRAAR